MGMRLVIVSMLSAGILFGLLGLALRRKWSRAAAITSLLIVLGNLYGLPIWAMLPVLAFSAWLAWSGRPTQRFNFIANLGTVFGTVVLILFIGIQVGQRDWFHSTETLPSVSSDLPDIYFIILDSRTSHEVLLQRFHYDDTPFLESLTSLGFRVGDCQSLYDQTDYSVASTLNPDANLPEESRLWEVIHNSQVRDVLEERGYQTVAFSTGFVWTEILNADIYYHPPYFLGGLNLFEIYYLNHTPFGWILGNFYDLNERMSDIYRERTQTLLTHLPDASEMDSPQFVFAHILQPHPPFVFDAEGNPANWRQYTLPGNANPAVREGYSRAGYDAGYVVAVQYVENAILPPLRTILSTNPNSIIILSADHGAWLADSPEESLSTFCAVYGASLPLEPRAAFEQIIK